VHTSGASGNDRRVEQCRPGAASAASAVQCRPKRARRRRLSKPPPNNTVAVQSELELSRLDFRAKCASVKGSTMFSGMTTLRASCQSRLGASHLDSTYCEVTRTCRVRSARRTESGARHLRAGRADERRRTTQITLVKPFVGTVLQPLDSLDTPHCCFRT
jgi:hypothetical protein